MPSRSERRRREREQARQRQPGDEPPQISRWRRPKYVEACAHNPDPNKPTAKFYVFDSSNPFGGFTVGRAFCKSWRCGYGCAEHESHVMFARLEEAFAPYEAEELVFMVLTFDAPIHERAFHDLDGVYWEIRSRFEWFRKRLSRYLERNELDDFESRWTAVVEQHASGVPHINVVFHAPRFARHLVSRHDTHRARGRSPADSKLLAGLQHDRNEEEIVLAEMLKACGFGYQSSAERVKSKGAVLGYMTQVAKHAGETLESFAESLLGKMPPGPRRRRGGTTGSTSGELAKTSQLPVAAPKGFRRLRSGVGFLPERKKGDKTGTILHHGYTLDGYPLIQSMVSSDRPLLSEMIAIAMELERDRVWQMRIDADEPRWTERAAELLGELAANNPGMPPALLEQMMRSELERERVRWKRRVDDAATMTEWGRRIAGLTAEIEQLGREGRLERSTFATARVQGLYKERARLRGLQRRELGKAPIPAVYAERLAAARVAEREYCGRELAELVRLKAASKRVSVTRQRRIDRLAAWIERFDRETAEAAATAARMAEAGPTVARALEQREMFEERRCS